MSSAKIHRNGQVDTHRKGKLSEKASSFNGNSNMPHAAAQIRRPRTVPDIVSHRSAAGAVPEGLPRQPPKLLLKVTVLGSLAPLQVLMRPESNVGDLIAAVVSQYVKEGRRPILPTDAPSGFDLHFSQFSLESLNREEKLVELGCRNFFLCPKKANTAAMESGGVRTAFASCAKEAGKVREDRGGAFGYWFKLMHFML